MPSGRAIRAGRAEIEIGANDKYSAALKRAQRRMRNFQRSVNAVGTQLARGAVGGGILFGISAKTFAEFDDRMRVVRAVTGATQQQFRAMTDEAKRLGATTSFSARQVADAMAELGRAGFTPDQIVVATESVLNLARATDTELARAAEIAGAALRGFGLDVSEMGRVVDVLTQTANGSAQTLEDLFEAFKPVAPLAATVGESIEDTAASLAILANNGIKGSLAGNALARAYKNLSTELKQGELKQLGVDAVDANGDLRALADIISDLAEATSDMGSAARLAAFESLFGRGAAAAVKLAESGDSFRVIADQIRASSGVARRAAEDMDAGLGGAFRRLVSATEAVGIAIGDAIERRFTRATDKITAFAGTIEKLVKANQDLVSGIASITLGVGVAAASLLTAGIAAQFLGFVFGGLATIITTAISLGGLAASAIGVIGASLLALASPVGIAVVAAAGLTAGIVALGTTALIQSGLIGQAISALKTAFGTLAGSVAPAMKGVRDAIMAGDIELAFKIVGKQVEVIWATLIGELKRKWIGFKNFVTKALLDIPRSTGNFLNEYIRDFAYGLAELGIISDKAAGNAPKIDFGSGGDRDLRNSLLDGAASREISSLDDSIRRLQDELRGLLERGSGPSIVSEEGDGGGGVVEKFRQLLDSITRSPESDIAKTSARGTFGANAVFGFGGSRSIAERTASAAERTADTSGEILSAIEQGGFGSFS